MMDRDQASGSECMPLYTHAEVDSAETWCPLDTGVCGVKGREDTGGMQAGRQQDTREMSTQIAGMSQRSAESRCTPAGAPHPARLGNVAS